MSRKDNLIKHGTIVMIATLTSGVLNYGYQIAMSRMLGPHPDGFPAFSVLMALFMIVALPSGTIQTVSAKYISHFTALGQKGKISYFISRFLRKCSIYFGILLCVFILFSYYIAQFLKISMVFPVIVTGFILFIGLLYPIAYGALQGLQKFNQLGWVYVLNAFAKICFGVLFVSIGWGVNGAVGGTLLAVILAFFLSFLFIKDMWTYKPYDKEIEKMDVYKYIVPVAIAYTFYGIINYADAFIVKRFFSESLDAGYYFMVAMIGKAFLFFPMSFSGVMFPKVASEYALGGDTKKILNKTLIYSLLGCAFGIMICCIFPKSLIQILMQKKDLTQEAFSTMIPLFKIIGFSITPYGITCILINYRLARHEYGFIPLFIIGALVQITLLLLFHNTLKQVLVVLLLAGLFIVFFGTGLVNPKFTLGNKAKT